MPSFCTMAHHPRASTDPDIKEQGAAVGQGHRGDGEFRDGVEVKKKTLKRRREGSLKEASGFVLQPGLKVAL